MGGNPRTYALLPERGDDVPGWCDRKPSLTATRRQWRANPPETSRHVSISDVIAETIVHSGSHPNPGKENCRETPENRRSRNELALVRNRAAHFNARPADSVTFWTIPRRRMSKVSIPVASMDRPFG